MSAHSNSLSGFILFNSVYAIGALPFAFLTDGGILLMKVVIACPLANILWYLFTKHRPSRQRLGVAVIVVIAVLALLVGFTVLGMLFQAMES